MAQELYRVDVPGSMMLMGEHAVLDGMQAIVCAINKRISIELIPTNSLAVTITDTRLGTLSLSLDALRIQDPFKFVLGAILQFRDKIKQGFTINIAAQFASDLGLGSSAAVTVGTVALLAQWLKIPTNNEQLFALAKDVVLQVQHRGSGADIAASIYGGVVGYTLHDIQKLPAIPHFVAIYCGYKTKTADVIAKVNDNKHKNPLKVQQIFTEINICAEKALQAIATANWPLLGRLFNAHYDLQRELGVSDKVLDELTQTLRDQPEILGAKISGAGLGDCVIGLGDLHRTIIQERSNMQQFLVEVDVAGLKYAYN